MQLQRSLQDLMHLHQAGWQAAVRLAGGQENAAQMSRCDHAGVYKAHQQQLCSVDATRVHRVGVEIQPTCGSLMMAGKSDLCHGFTCMHIQVGRQHPSVRSCGKCARVHGIHTCECIAQRACTVSGRHAYPELPICAAAAVAAVTPLGMVERLRLHLLTPQALPTAAAAPSCCFCPCAGATAIACTTEDAAGYKGRR